MTSYPPKKIKDLTIKMFSLSVNWEPTCLGELTLIEWQMMRTY